LNLIKKVFCGLFIMTFLIIAIQPVFAETYLPKETIIRDINNSGINWKMAEGETIVAGMLSDTNIWGLEDAGMIELFEEITGIRVIMDIFNETELRQKTHVDLLSDTGIFDLIMVDPMYIGTFAQANSIEKLDNYFNDEELCNKDWFKWPEDFPLGFREMGMYNNNQYGIPMSISGTLFYYNKKEFENAGLDPNKPPKTFEEVENYANILNNPEGNLAGIALRGLRGGGLNVFIWSSFLKSYGGQWFNEDWEPMLNSEEAIKSIEVYSRLNRNYGPPGVTDWEWSKIMNAMANGTIAMTIDAPTFVMTIEDPEKSNTLGEWSYSTQPKGPNGITMVPYSWYLTINSSSKHKKAAWLFSQFILSEPVQTAIGGPLVATGRLSVLENKIWEEKFEWVTDWRTALLENTKYADPDARPRIPEWAQIGDVMGIELQAAISGSKTPKEAAEAANKKIREIMDNAGYYK